MKAEQRHQQQQHKDSTNDLEIDDETFPMKEFEPDQKSNDSSSRASTPTLKISALQNPPMSEEADKVEIKKKNRKNKNKNISSEGDDEEKSSMLHETKTQQKKKLKTVTKAATATAKKAGNEEEKEVCEV